MIKQTRNLYSIPNLLISLFILISVFVCYYGISEYMTIDESLWIGRFTNFSVVLIKKICNLFGSNYEKIRFWKNLSGMTNRLIVGLPGIVICKVTGQSGFESLPIFRIIQITEWILLLVIILFCLNKYMDIKLHFLFLTIFTTPLLRGMAKIINYDCFVSLFVFLSLLSYYCYYFHTRKYFHYVLSVVFAVLAILTKSSGIFAPAFIFFFECKRCAEDDLSTKKYFIRIVKEFSKAFLVIIASFVVFVPLVYLEPSSLLSLIKSYSEQIVKQPLVIKLISPFLIVAVPLLIKAASHNEIESKLKNLRIPVYLKFGIPLVVVVLSLLIQQDYMRYLSGYNVEEMKLHLKEHDVSYSVVTAHHFTYLHGRLSSILLNLFNLVKILLFTTPVPLLFFFVVGFYRGNKKHVAYWFLFLVFYVAVYAVMLILPIHRYLLPCYYSVAMISAYGLKTTFESYKKHQPIFVSCVLLSLLPQLATYFPTDLGYSNFLRNKRIDDSFEIAGTGSEGLWAGWGEHNAPVVRYLNTLKGADTLKVLFDYKYAVNFKGEVAYGNAFDIREHADIDYFVMSKTIWYRDKRSLDYIQKNRPVKIFSKNGTRYSFLFKGPLPESKPKEYFPLPLLK